MKRLRLLLLALALAGCASVAPPPEPKGRNIAITAERVAECQAQGGCGLMSKSQIMDLMQQAYDLAKAEDKEALDSHGCKRGAV